VLAGSPNVYCKVSGLVTEANWTNWRPAEFEPYLDVAFNLFGPDRLIFGSDWPVCLLAATYRQVRELVEQYMVRLPTQVREKIFGLNAIDFYGLAR
jgi:L-fuconolactonase